MRLMITTDTVGGVWTFTRELVEGLLGDQSKGSLPDSRTYVSKLAAEHRLAEHGLAEEHISAVLMSFGRIPSQEQQRWADAMSAQAPGRFRYYPTPYKLEWMPDGHADVAASCGFLLDCIRREQPDLLHTNQFCYGALHVDIPKVLTAHSDVVSWWFARYGKAPPSDAWMLAYLEIVAGGLAGADTVVTPTAWYAEQLHAHFGLAGEKCRVIPNGRTLRTQPTATGRKLQAVSAGRLWDEGKNTAILSEVNSPVPVFVAGEARAPGSASVNIAPGTLPGAPPNVTFTGALPEDALSQLYRESALYIATSRYEPFGLAPLEAVLAGCALIANDVPSFREVWEDAAIYYRRDDAGSLSETLSRLSRNPGEIQAAAARAYARAAHLYTQEAMVEGYTDLYTALMRERAAAHVA